MAAQVPADGWRNDRPRRSYSLDGHRVEAAPIAPGLHIVSTPIGNLGDITLRALSTLAAADLIACEDTRVTRKLLDRYAIAAPLTPYHDHNAATARPKLLQRLAEGAAIALVSDAGTPLISDPGYKLVRAVAGGRLRRHRDPRRFIHSGGAGRRGPAHRPVLLCRIPAAQTGRAPRPHCRIGARAGNADRVRNRTAACRNAGRSRRRRSASAKRRCAASSPSCMKRSGAHPLTTLAQASAEQETRGEFVLVIAPPAAAALPSEDDADALLRAALARTSLKDAVGEVAVATGLPRRTLYQRALALADEKDQEADVMARRAQPLRPPTTPRPDRVEAFRLGLSAESRAAMFLIAKGYRILARRFKTPLGEIDIVARPPPGAGLCRGQGARDVPTMPPRP